jgi:hypothetical protein
VPAHPRPAVPGELDEVERVRNRQRAREVGEEDDARLQRADEERLVAGEVTGDLGTELADPRGELVAREVDLADPRV